MKWYVLAIVFLLLLLTVSVGTNLWQYRQWTQQVPAVADTIRVTDTLAVHDTVPRMVCDTLLRTVLVAVRDTVTGDTVGTAMLPVVQRTFTDDSLYTAWVSGAVADSVAPMLDSISLRFPVHTVTIRERTKPRWNVGIQGGVFLTPQGIQPGIGVGIQWNL